MNRLFCAFTGHRPKFFPWGYNETDPRCVKLRAALSDQIGILVNEGYTDFLCGMGLGCDVWAAETVLSLRESHPKLKLHCILPCVGQEKPWTDAAKARYYSLVRQADSRVYTSRGYYKDCMLDRNRFMVDHSRLLFAVYSGVSRSGTASTINYARSHGREILILDPQTNSVTRENTNQPI